MAGFKIVFGFIQKHYWKKGLNASAADSEVCSMEVKGAMYKTLQGSGSGVSSLGILTLNTSSVRNMEYYLQWDSNVTLFRWWPSFVIDHV